jgi:hypothetical protein
MRRVQRRAIGDLQRQVVQADVLAPIEGDMVGWILDPPEREHAAPVGDVHGGISRPLPDHLPAQAVHEEAARRFQIRDRQADVVETQRHRISVHDA